MAVAGVIALVSLLSVGLAPAAAHPVTSLPTGPAIGRLDSVAAVTSTSVSFAGWALDPDTTSSILVEISLDGSFRTQVTADQSRPDIAAAYPGYGAGHGYTGILAFVAPGAHTVCATAVNVPASAPDPVIGCQSVTVINNIVGKIDSIVAGPGTVTVTGWVIDRSTTSPISVNLSGDINGPGNPGVDWDTSATADVNRSDVAAAFPGFGPNHGFVIIATHVPTGSRFFSMNAGTVSFDPAPITLATGPDHPVFVPPSNPFGSMDTGSLSAPGIVSVSGWAADSDAPSTSIPVHVYVDGRFASALTADGYRPDVAAIWGPFGANHGYATTLSLPAGVHTVCSYGINQGLGNDNAQLGCRSVSVGGNPFGALDTALVPSFGTVTLTGWTIDPDTGGSTSAHVYVDGVFAQAVPADGVRPDLATAFPGFGGAHGVSTSVSGLSGGLHSVCLYGINVQAGDDNPRLGCRVVSLPTGNPFGALDTAVPGPGSISLTGWAIDPDSTSTVAVHVYLDGVFDGAFVANALRSDVGVAFPGYGSMHGYALTALAPVGAHTVCVYGINQGPGNDNPALGCHAVAVTSAAP